MRSGRVPHPIPACDVCVDLSTHGAVSLSIMAAFVILSLVAAEKLRHTKTLGASGAIYTWKLEEVAQFAFLAEVFQ